jgi:hypothetical protein
MVNYHMQGQESKEHSNVDWRTKEKSKGGRAGERGTMQEH